MGSILEKITLYDILGYLLSGCFLEIIICLEYILEKWISTDGMLMQQKEALEQFNSFFIVAFIVGGYCLGVILSEGSMLINKKLGYENKIEYDNRAITDEILKKAILNTGLVEKQELERRLLAKGTKDSQKIYGNLMYALLQHDEKYKRIHNYGSGKLMYRNLCGAMVVGGIYIIYRIFRMKWFHIWVIVCGIIYILGIRVLHSRYKKYCAKSQEYVRVWFAEKYLK